MTMKISPEAADRNLKEINDLQSKWMDTEVPSNNKGVKIIIYASKRDGFTRGSGIAGVPFTPGWWKVFQYWMSTKLKQEGLEEISIEIEQEV